LWQQGKFEESIAALRKSSWARDLEIQAALERGYSLAGPKGVFLELAQSMAARSEPEYISSAEIATLFARAGRVDLSIEWLENAFDAREPSLVHAMFGPELDPLRSDPRFANLCRRMGLPK
jgi:hypothetical protein